mmetsp:Transcript_13615/g.39007  ORF Transcript_13615/g.39007 Transcript_13615/m.39007 type:complete len:220 (+) Transcript_13615:1094-1753(+)
MMTLLARGSRSSKYTACRSLSALIGDRQLALTNPPPRILLVGASPLPLLPPTPPPPPPPTFVTNDGPAQGQGHGQGQGEWSLVAILLGRPRRGRAGLVVLPSHPADPRVALAAVPRAGAGGAAVLVRVVPGGGLSEDHHGNQGGGTVVVGGGGDPSRPTNKWRRWRRRRDGCRRRLTGRRVDGYREAPPGRGDGRRRCRRAQACLQAPARADGQQCHRH